MFVRPVTFVDFYDIADVKAESSSNLCFYDIDNDSDVELIVAQWECGQASVEGGSSMLRVVKYDHVAWEAVVDGNAACVVGGRVTRSDEPQLVVFCSNCRVFLFRVRRDTAMTTTDGVAKSADSCEVRGQQADYCVLECIHTQLVAPNAKSVVIEDVDGDGNVELVVGGSDRTVRMYRWRDEDRRGNSGGLEQLIKWELTGQVGRVTTHWSQSVGWQVLASQPGGSYAVLEWDEATPATSNRGRQGGLDEEGISSVGWVALARYRCVGEETKDSASRSSDLRSEIIGNIHRGGTGNIDQTYIALCSIDGDLVMLEGSERIWQVRLGRGELFGLCKVDITNDDAEEVVVCSWEGATYILNHRKAIAKFCPHRRHHHCQAFIAGKFAVTPGNNQPVLAYSTLSVGAAAAADSPGATAGSVGGGSRGGLLLYYNLRHRLQRIHARSLIQDIQQTQSLLWASLASLVLQPGTSATAGAEIAQRQTARLISEVLYQWPARHRYGDTDDFFRPDRGTVQSPLLHQRPARADAFNSD